MNAPDPHLRTSPVLLDEFYIYGTTFNVANFKDVVPCVLWCTWWWPGRQQQQVIWQSSTSSIQKSSYLLQRVHEDIIKIGPLLPRPPHLQWSDDNRQFTGVLKYNTKRWFYHFCRWFYFIQHVLFLFALHKNRWRIVYLRFIVGTCMNKYKPALN